ncbi:MarR family winged helix-turn-helix transcriptional regulator [Priestia megaterium]|uniref:MarR family winged helix-turn-helix transcriptional regulator n=1 Tax=Priestia megaterium TaxID=1404 RepID=UPI0015D52206|nr:MarR family transcriptional regulator [Priestia megaterium]MED4030218.1 MarR family transcriptional regulator [Priestia megaterium]
MLQRADFIRESNDYIHRYILKNIQKRVEELGFTFPQALVVGTVNTHQPISIKELAKHLKMTHSTVSDIVERLTKKGVLMKAVDPKDRRAVQVRLSEEFVEEVKDIDANELINKSIVEALSKLKPEEQEIVEKGFQLFLSAVKANSEGLGIEEIDPLDVINQDFFK